MRAVLFDLDGTLVDTAPDLTGSLNDVLALEGLPPIPEDMVRHLVGHGARALIEKGLAAHGRTAPMEKLDRLKGQFLEIYERRLARLSRLFPGAIEVLDMLENRAVPLGIVTNKPEYLTRLLMGALSLTARFGVLVGHDTAAKPKPHADPILYAAQRLGVPLSGTILVGDSATDVQAARAAGIPVVLVRHGYTPVPADELGADAVVDGFADLLAALAGVSCAP